MMTQLGEKLGVPVPVFRGRRCGRVGGRRFGGLRLDGVSLLPFGRVRKPGLSFVRLRPTCPSLGGLGFHGRKIENLDLCLDLGLRVAANAGGSDIDPCRGSSGGGGVRATKPQPRALMAKFRA